MEGATVEHILPGRIRLRFAARRGDAPFFEDLVRKLSEHPLVNRVKANPLTGSLLLEHSAGPSELAAFAEHSGLPIPVDPSSTAPSAQSRARTRTGLNGARLSAPATTLTTLGLYQAARGRLLGTGGELLWHSLAVSRTKYGWLAALLLASGVVQVLRGRLLPPASSLIVYAILFDEIWGRAERHNRPMPLPPHESSIAPLAPET